MLHHVSIQCVTADSSIYFREQHRYCHSAVSRELQLWPCSIAITRTACAREQGLTCTIAAELLASRAASDDSIDGRTTSFTRRNHPPRRSDRLPERPGAHHHRERRAFVAHPLIAFPQTPTIEIRHQSNDVTNQYNSTDQIESDLRLPSTNKTELAGAL